MLEIFGRKNSSNVIPVMWLVGELGLEHVRHNIGNSFGGDNTEEYLAMNPNGLIPTIKDNGFILHESHAILRYLCREYDQGNLWPDNRQERALVDQWMEWHKSSFMPNLMPVFFNLVRTAKADQNTTAIKQGTATAIKYLRVLEQHLNNNSYVVGNQFTLADIPLGALMYKFYNLEIERPSLPNIEAWYARLCERPAYQKHAMVPFGSSPDEWLALEKAGA